MGKRYKVVIAQSAKIDVKNKKQYILKNFKYRDYAETFSSKIKEAARELEILPQGYRTTGFVYRSYEIYLKPAGNDLLFYTMDEAKKEVMVLRVLQDGMDWEYIIQKWIKKNS